MISCVTMLIGWLVFPPNNEVGCITILYYPTNVRSIPHVPDQLTVWNVHRTTLAAVILNYFGWYCSDSLSPRWAHVYVRLYAFRSKPLLTLSVDHSCYIVICIDRHVLSRSTLCTRSRALSPTQAAFEAFRGQSCRYVFLRWFDSRLLIS